MSAPTSTSRPKAQPMLLVLMLVATLLSLGMVSAKPAEAAGGGSRTFNAINSTAPITLVGYNFSSSGGGRLVEGIVRPGFSAIGYTRVDLVGAPSRFQIKCTDSGGRHSYRTVSGGSLVSACPGNDIMTVRVGV